VLAWLTGGESLHNNHHAYPSSPKFSMGRFEFDPSWVVIRVLMLLRLARLVGDTEKVRRVALLDLLHSALPVSPTRESLPVGNIQDAGAAGIAARRTD
jgi:hypothetical protein